MSRIRAEVSINSKRPREASESSVSTEGSDLSPQTSASPATSPLQYPPEDAPEEARKNSARSLSRPPERSGSIQFRHVRAPRVHDDEPVDQVVPGEAPDAPTARLQSLDLEVERSPSEERGGNRLARRERRHSATHRNRVRHRHRRRSLSPPSESTESMERMDYDPRYPAYYGEHGYPPHDPYAGPPQQGGYYPPQPGYGAPPQNPGNALMHLQPHQNPYAHQMVAPYQQPPYQAPGYLPPAGMPYYPWQVIGGPTSSPIQPQAATSPTREISAAEIELANIKAMEARRTADRIAQLEEEKYRAQREADAYEARKREQVDSERQRQDAVRKALDDYKKTLTEEALKKAEFERAVKDAEKAANDANAEKVRELEVEHKKKLDEATAATDAVSLAFGTLTAEMEAAKPPPEKQQRVVLIDPRQDKKREFRLPFTLAKDWKNFENLLYQAFEKETQHGVSLGTLIDEGKYDLVHKDGTTILRQYWDQVVEPGWEVKVNLWPVPAPVHVSRRDSHGHRRKDGALKRSKSKAKKRESLLFLEVGEGPPVPPSHSRPNSPSANDLVAIVDDDDLTISSKSATKSNAGKKRPTKPPTFWDVFTKSAKPKKK